MMLMLTLMNPDLSVLLLTLGLLLIYLEVNTPGTVVPGAAADGHEPHQPAGVARDAHAGTRRRQ